MKQTNFAKWLTGFLSEYLPGERGCSINTVKAYRDTMLLFLIYMKSKHDKPADRLDFKDITQEKIVSFLEWLEQERTCSISTRNARLAAIHSFFKYLQYKVPEQLAEWQRILQIRNKKVSRPTITYLTAEGLKLFFQQPNTDTKRGRRDLALIYLLFESGARVQELIDMTPSRVTFGSPSLLRITGKGNKSRIVPISDQAATLLRSYMIENNLLESYANEYPLFGSKIRCKFTRMGITSIVKKYANKARKIKPSLIPSSLTPHSMRHSKAMILQKAGVNIVSIRDLLGHVSVTTTEIYVRINNQQKIAAIKHTALSNNENEYPSWQKDKGLLVWLESLGK
jgi:site-specific recombinase XerD